MNRFFTKRLGNALSLPLFPIFPFACYAITLRWEKEMGIPRLAIRASRAFLIMLSTGFFYFYIIPPLWFREGATGLDRALIRILMHPIMFEAASLTIRVFSRSTDFGPHANLSMIPVLASPLLWLSSLYGRFLIASSGSFALTITVSLIVGALECFLRLSSGKRDWLWFRLTKGAAYADSMMHDPPKLAYRARLVALDAISEWYSIIIGSLVQYLFQNPGTHGGNPVSFRSMIASIFLQLTIEIVVIAFITILEERYAKVPVRKEWRDRESKRVYFWGHFSTALIFSYFTIVTLTFPYSDSFFKYVENHPR